MLLSNVWAFISITLTRLILRMEGLKKEKASAKAVQISNTGLDGIELRQVSNIAMI